MVQLFYTQAIILTKVKQRMAKDMDLVSNLLKMET